MECLVDHSNWKPFHCLAFTPVGEASRRIVSRNNLAQPLKGSLGLLVRGFGAG